MEKVTLYNPETDKMYDILLSIDDARRAASDLNFATRLMNVANREQNEHEQSEAEQTKETSENLDIDVHSIDNYEENSLYRWSEATVLLLLRIYQEMEQKFNDGKISHKKCWEMISKKLKDHGYNITGSQCASKLRSLKKTYKSIKDHNSKSGNDRRTWQHFEIMEEIFSKKAWCKPLAVASSSGLSVKNTNTEESITSNFSCTTYDSAESLNDKENNLPQTSMQDTKTMKMSTTKLFQKRLAQKEMHEQKKQKRHDDRMVMEQKLIDVLTKYLEK